MTSQGNAISFKTSSKSGRNSIQTVSFHQPSTNPFFSSPKQGQDGEFLKISKIKASLNKTKSFDAIFANLNTDIFFLFVTLKIWA